jgi:uncharacterized protein (DUF58 family)
MALTGRAAALAAALVVLVFLLPLNGRMVGYAGIGLLVLCIADVSLAASPKRMSVRRDGATSTRVGEAAEVTVIIENGERRARGWVRDCWPPSAAATPRATAIDVAANERVVVRTTLRPTRRGERRAAAVTLRLTGPLGLAARQRNRRADWVVQVLPPFTSRRFLPEKLARLRQLDGAVVAPIRGQGSEFDSLREYVVGDDVRAIDWRATARGGDVVVRTWRPERDRQLLLVLDSGRTSAARVGAAPRFDAALDAALLLTALARHAGDRVAVIAHDRVLRVSVQASSGATLAHVVDALTPVQPQLTETDMERVVAEVLRRLRRRSLVVLFTALEPAVLRDSLQPALAPLLRRHVVVLASVDDPDVTAMRGSFADVDATYRAAAAEAADNERSGFAQALQRRGVVITRSGPEMFASHVADTYLDLKAAGRL